MDISFEADETLVSNPNIPREFVNDPSTEEGRFDSEQIQIITLTGSYDLICIENANELARLEFMKDGVFEKIIKAMVDNSPDKNKFVVCPSDAFPEVYLHGVPADGQQGSDEEVISYIDKTITYKANVDRLISDTYPRPKFAVTILACGWEEGGHYCSFFYDIDRKAMFIFDSMQTTEKGSAYTSFFSGLAMDAFGAEIVTVPETMIPVISPQPTGGFTGIATRAERIYGVEWASAPETIKHRWYMRLVSPDSQNHFCYAWSLWALHARILNLNIYDLLQNFIMYPAGIATTWNRDPLILIRRYMYGLMTYFKMINKMSKLDIPFFKYNFARMFGSLNQSVIQEISPVTVTTTFNLFTSAPGADFNLIFTNATNPALLEFETKASTPADVKILKLDDVKRIESTRIAWSLMDSLLIAYFKIRHLLLYQKIELVEGLMEYATEHLPTQTRKVMNMIIDASSDGILVDAPNLPKLGTLRYLRA